MSLLVGSKSGTVGFWDDLSASNSILFKDLDQEENYWYESLKELYQKLGYTLSKKDKIQFKEWVEQGMSGQAAFSYYLSLIGYFIPGAEKIIQVTDCLIQSVFTLNNEHFNYFYPLSSHEYFLLEMMSKQKLLQKYPTLRPDELKLVNLSKEDTQILISMFDTLKLEFEQQPWSYNKKTGQILLKKQNLSLTEICSSLGKYHSYEMFLEVVAWLIAESGTDLLWKDYRQISDLASRKNIIGEIITSGKIRVIHTLNQIVIAVAKGAILKNRDDYLLQLVDTGLINGSNRRVISEAILNSGVNRLVDILTEQQDFINALVPINKVKLQYLSDETLVSLLELSVIKK